MAANTIIPKKYGALRLLVRAFNGLAAISMLIGIYYLLTNIIDFRYFGANPPIESGNETFRWLKIVNGKSLDFSLMPIVFGFIGSFVFLCYAQMLRVFIDIEYNQRISNELLFRAVKTDTELSENLISENINASDDRPNKLLSLITLFIVASLLFGVIAVNFSYWLINSGGSDNIAMSIVFWILCGLCVYGIFYNHNNTES